MTSDRRNHLCRVMTLAWGLYRDATGARTFADALRSAWAFIKKVGQTKLAKALRRGGNVFLADTIKSPIRARYGARASVGGRNSANYLTARVGA